MKVKVTIPYTIRPTPEEVKAKNVHAKDWELLDPDGMRYSFNNTEQEARDELYDHVYDTIFSSNFEIHNDDDEGEEG